MAALPVWSQEQVSLTPLHQTFTPQEYSAHNQNWSVDFDQQGRIYIANNDGVLIYDGGNWQILSNFKLGIIRSVVVGSNNVLYVGGQGALGKYQANTNGLWQYSPIEIPPELHDIGAIWNGLEYNDHIYFAASNYLLILALDGTLRAIPSNGRVSIGQSEDFNWVYFPQRGLFKLNDLEGAAVVPVMKSRIMGVHAAHDGLMIVSRDGNLFRFDHSTKQLSKLPDTGLNKEEKNIIVASVSEIPQGLAVSVWHKGLYLIDKNANLIRHYQESTFSALDAEYANGNLWIAFDGAMVRMPWPVLLEKYDSESALKSKIQSIAKFEEVLYLGSNRDLYKMANSQLNRVQLINDEQSVTAWQMHSSAEGVLAVTQSGTFLINQDSSKMLIEGITRGLGVLHTPAKHYFVTSMTSGLYVIKVNAETTEIVAQLKDFKPYTTDIIQSDNGDIFVGTRKDGIYRIKMDDMYRLQISHLSPQQISQDSEHDPFVTLFEDQGVVKAAVSGKVCVPTFSPELSCPTDPTFGHARSMNQYIGRDNKGTIYSLASPTHNALFRQSPEGKFERLYSNFDELPGTRLNQVLNHDPWVILARRDGLWRYKPENLIPSPAPRAWIQSIKSGREDLYHSATMLKRLPTEITTNKNSLRFAFASNLFSHPEQHLWRTKLAGYDEQYSSWSSDNWKDYTKLSGGNYQFFVQMKSRQGRVSEPASISFSVAYPWYQSSLAYISYFLCGLVMFFGAAHWLTKRRTYQIRLRHDELEKRVQSRTLEVEQKNSQLAKQAEQLAALDQAKSRFFANITHEFRTPLTLTLGSLEDAITGRYGDLSDQAKDALKLANKRSKQLLDLIEELLDIARIDASALPLHAHKLDLVTCCKVVLSQLDSWAESKQILLHKKSVIDSAKIVADERQITKVLSNLMSNAIKFTPEQGKVEVSISEDSCHYIVTVSDNGPGIAEDEINYIFERFHQVHDAGQLSLGGVGLGLSLAKEISELHGGTLVVNSAPDQGCQFILTLPKNTGLPESSTPSEATIGQHESVTPKDLNVQQVVNERCVDKRILVVEDDDDLRQFIAGHLKEQYQVSCSKNGEEGLRKAQTYCPDLIVCDVMMPIMDGMEMCQRLKSSSETDYIPIILLTARKEDKDRIAGFDIGADDYLIKPFSTQVLKSRIANLIASRQTLLARAGEATINFPETKNLINRDKQFINQLRKIIQAGLSDSHFSIEKMAAEIHMERTTLYKKVQTIFDTTPSELLINARLDWAKTLLASNEGNIAEIAFTVGYNSVAHFSQTFKKHFAKTPSEYRKNKALTN